MKICVIYDKKGDCPCYASVTPNKDVFIRELSLACKNDKNLLYAIYPEDYRLFEIDLSSGKPVSNFVDFSDFLRKEVDPNGEESN